MKKLKAFGKPLDRQEQRKITGGYGGECIVTCITGGGLVTVTFESPLTCEIVCDGNPMINCNCSS